VTEESSECSMWLGGYQERDHVSCGLMNAMKYLCAVGLKDREVS
jgi:hypothetical protein